MSRTYTAEAATAMLALVGVDLEPGRAASVAETLSAQVGAANRTFSQLSFETEPATYLVVREQEAP
jgi:hypothetical protein